MFGMCGLCYLPAKLIVESIQNPLPLFWAGMVYQGLVSYFILKDI